MNKRLHDKLIIQKHLALRKLGIKPPKDREENKKRMKEAHHGI